MLDLYDLGVSEWGSQCQMSGSSLEVSIFISFQTVVLESIYALPKIDYQFA